MGSAVSKDYKCRSKEENNVVFESYNRFILIIDRRKRIDINRMIILMFGFLKLHKNQIKFLKSIIIIYVV